MTQAKLGTPITLAYGEQGPLSLVVTVGASPQAAPPAIPLTFVDSTQTWGLDPKSTSDKKSAGACVLDFDADGHADLFLTGYGANGGMALLRNTGAGKFVDVTKNAGLPALPAIACAAADYDNDSKTDLAVAYADHVALYHNEGGKFRDVTDTVGLKAKGPSRGLLWVDNDHDGDADLLITKSESGSQLWRNNGNSTFVDVTTESALSFVGTGTAAIASDVNNDRAVDLIVSSETGLPLLFSNPREGKWTSSSPWPDTTKSATSITSLDFNKDGWMDLALTTASAPGVVLLRNVDGRKYEQVALPPTGWSRATSIIAIDYDNDGFIDLFAAGIAANGKPEIKLFRNIGPDKFEDATSQTALNRLTLKSDAFLASSISMATAIPILS